jgi:bifunctional ADP-heptose synthase (sugar kinase/adenylyltransferase)
MRKKIVIIGETCVDKFVYCKVNRLSPEAPVPILNPIRTVKNNGMAGNTVANVKSLLPECSIITFSPIKNPTKTRYVEEKTNHMFFRFDEGDDEIEHFEWSEDYEYFLQDADLVIVSDYNKGYLSNTDLKLIALHSKISILDSKRKLTNDITKSFTFIKLNEEESQNNSDIDKSNVITTLGSAGAMFNDIIYPSPKPQETIDVSGAGDTFTAAFAVNYLNTKNVLTSILSANEASAKVVSKRGVVTP